MGIIDGIINGITNMVTGVKNYEQQEEQNEWVKGFEQKKFNNMVDNQNYQKALQQNIFNREDSAVQRRTKDLESAGFSRLLSAGGAGAGGGNVVQTESGGGGNTAAVKAAQYNNMGGFQDGIEGTFNAMTMRQNIRQSKTEEILTREKAKTEAVERNKKAIETLLTEVQTAKTQADKDKARKEIEALNANIKSINSQTASTEYNLDMSKKTGTKTNNAMNTHEVYNSVNAAANAIKNNINEEINKADNEALAAQLSGMTVTELMNWKDAKGGIMNKEENAIFNEAMNKAKRRKKK